MNFFETKRDNVNSKFNPRRKTFLINQLYTGAHLKEGYNVGHKAINMIPTKDNEHYLYITPKGTIKDKKKADKIESIIFVQHISKDRVYEIVGIATELTRTNKERKDCKHKDDKNIEYGNDSINASLKDIFSENTYHGQLDITEAYTTFKAKNVRVPRTPITIILFFRYPQKHK